MRQAVLQVVDKQNAVTLHTHKLPCFVPTLVSSSAVSILRFNSSPHFISFHFPLFTFTTISGPSTHTHSTLSIG